MNRKLICLPLFGHWEDVSIQGTSRTFRLYARHPLDRLLTVGLVLLLWLAMFIHFFCRTAEPGTVGILLRGLGILYLPTDIKPLLRLFLFWMAIPIPFVAAHILEYGRQKRILRGELTARPGILRKIGYLQDYKYRTVTARRLLLEVSSQGRTAREVYKMPEHLFKEFQNEQGLHACRVELALLPPKKPKARKHSGDFASNYIDQLHMRVEHIFYLETLPARCEPVRDFLFTPEKPSGQKAARKRKH